MIRKSFNALPEGTIVDNRLQNCYPLVRDYSLEISQGTTGIKRYKGLIKLALGMIYFLSLVTAITILLT